MLLNIKIEIVSLGAEGQLDEGKRKLGEMFSKTEKTEWEKCQISG